MMHWAVELPSLPGAPVQVSAESWKTALTEARKGVALAKFRVDFEEDGTVRVHDLISNERFVLRPTSADPSATAVPSAPTTPAAAPAASPPVAATPFAKTASSPAIVAPPASVPMPAGAKPASARVSSPPSEPAKPATISGAKSSAASPWPKPANPLASTQLTGTPSTVAMAPSAVSQVSSPSVGTVQSVVVLSQASISTTAPSTASPVALPSPPIEPAQTTELQLPPGASLFHRRDRERSAGNDLTYRERLIAVPPATSQVDATLLARDVWRQLVQILLPLQPGKFVSIAIFDHAFQSRPERPPITVLQWKDWRSAEPEISYPGSNASIPPGAPASMPPAAQPVTVPVPTPAAPIAIVSPPPSVEAPKILSHPQMPAVRPSMVSMQTIGFGEMNPQMLAALNATPAPSDSPSSTPAAPISQPSIASTSTSQPPTSQPFGQGPDISIPVPLVQIAPPVPLVQHSLQPASQKDPGTQKNSQPNVQPSAQVAPTMRATRRTDELLGDAFEALQDLAFLREHTEACEYVVKITTDLLPQTDIALSLYDIDHDELVLEICSDPTRRGTRAKIVRGHARSDATLRTTTLTFPSWQPDPYLPSVPEGAVLFAGISHDSRLFGVLELHRAPGQKLFDLAETGAVSYVTAQLGQFLADHSRRVGFKEEAPGTRGNRR